MTAPTRHSSRLNGSLSLGFERYGDGTVLTIHEQTPPLRVIRAFQGRDGATLAHLHNVSGGVLGGDCLDLTVHLHENAVAQLTTTSATRLYCTGVGKPPAVQTNTIHVGPNALLEMAPDALIPFAGASYVQHTRIDLADGAGLFWWETVAPGRKASNERFVYDLLDLTMEITSDGIPLTLERLKLEPKRRDLLSPARLGLYDYFTTFYICRVGLTSDRWMALERDLGELAARLSCQGETLWGVSSLVAHGLVIRGLAQSQPQIADGLLAFWQAAKQTLYGQSAVPPRKIY